MANKSAEFEKWAATELAKWVSPYSDELQEYMGEFMQACWLAYQAGGKGEPVAWRVKDYADGWILCDSEAKANSCAGDGAIIEPLYRHAPEAPDGK
jgi:hypothetical protein